MQRVRISPQQRAILEIAEKNGGRCWPDLVYRELLGHPKRNGNKHGKRDPIPVATRVSVSRSIARLAKHGMVKLWPGGDGFWLPGYDGSAEARLEELENRSPNTGGLSGT